MEREILFRGKKVNNGKWIEGYCTRHRNFKDEVFSVIIPFDKDCAAHFDDRVLVEENTVGQFTGLTDKNGRKIFEGDIVALNPLLLGVYVVKWNEEQCRFGMYLHNLYEQAGFNRETMKRYVVIGNIYENTELLKLKNKTLT